MIHRIYTENPENVCTWLREMPSCSCLTVLPGPAWVLRSKTCKPLFPPLYYAFFSFTAFSFRTFSKLRLFMHDHGKKSLKAPLPDQRMDRCSFLWGMSWSDDACNIRTEQSQQTQVDETQSP